jgi:hypothetical protein
VADLTVMLALMASRAAHEVMSVVLDDKEIRSSLSGGSSPVLTDLVSSGLRLDGLRLASAVLN